LRLVVVVADVVEEEEENAEERVVVEEVVVAVMRLLQSMPLLLLPTKMTPCRCGGERGWFLFGRKRKGPVEDEPPVAAAAPLKEPVPATLEKRKKPE